MIEPKHPDVKPGDRIRLPRTLRHPVGEVVAVVSRRSVDTVRVRHEDGTEESVTDWEPVR
jgi:hypothetical protein